MNGKYRAVLVLVSKTLYQHTYGRVTLHCILIGEDHSGSVSECVVWPLVSQSNQLCCTSILLVLYWADI